MIEVTDEMVHRARDMALGEADRQDVVDEWNIGVECVRKMLNAALNPPPAPEVEVTEEMIREGAGAIGHYEDLNQVPYRELVAAFYKAMYAARPKEKGEESCSWCRLKKSEWPKCTYCNDFEGQEARLRPLGRVTIDDEAVARAYNAWMDAPSGPCAVFNAVNCALFAAFPDAVDCRSRVAPKAPKRRQKDCT